MIIDGGAKEFEVYENNCGALRFQKKAQEHSQFMTSVLGRIYLLPSMRMVDRLTGDYQPADRRAGGGRAEITAALEGET